MEPKEPSPTHPNLTEHKQEPPTRSRGRPRLPTEQKEQPPKRPRGRPRLTAQINSSKNTKLIHKQNPKKKKWNSKKMWSEIELN